VRITGEKCPSWDRELDDPKPDRDVNEDYVQPAADAFTTTNSRNVTCRLRVP
jgi:hypothetical protein